VYTFDAAASVPTFAAAASVPTFAAAASVPTFAAAASVPTFDAAASGALCLCRCNDGLVRFWRSGSASSASAGGPNRQDPVTLITEAAPSLDDQHDARRRKYLILMGVRIVCLFFAVLTAPISLWFAAAFIVGGLILPWCAVLIANDRPPKQASRFARYRPPSEQRALPAPPDDGDVPAPQPDP
jgi:Protein of unknown function (DUF3099)